MEQQTASNYCKGLGLKVLSFAFTGWRGGKGFVCLVFRVKELGASG